MSEEILDGFGPEDDDLDGMSEELELSVTHSGTTKKRKGVKNETRAERIARVRAFYADRVNAKFYTVGTLLAQRTKTGKTIAERLIAGESFPMSSIAINGVKYPLVEGFVLSLATCASVWGCFVCNSAHGTGIAPSKGMDATLLASNPFFYNPQTQELFTVSKTCWGLYVASDDDFPGIVKRFGAGPKPKSPVVPPVVPAVVPTVPPVAKGVTK